MIIESYGYIISLSFLFAGVLTLAFAVRQIEKNLQKFEEQNKLSSTFFKALDAVRVIK